MERLKSFWGNCWVILGDLNDIKSNGEKLKGRVRPESSFVTFNNFINNNELLDIGLEGVPWSWCNNWGKEGEVKERIDRILGTKQWCANFEWAKCSHIETEASDHCALILDTTPARRIRKRRFRFDRRWLLQEDIGAVIKDAWKTSQQGSRYIRWRIK